ncbi:hypothetical protein N186_07065 [Thermofilum adornatum]|uniref:Uncharacterized protein n=1 Tax=Thermofilum adornatum TaxID=1365176 RepID=S5ZME8_9CREN|nr:hypothetical protein N186_07065 [Thermofilum adornatum]
MHRLVDEATVELFTAFRFARSLESLSRLTGIRRDKAKKLLYGDTAKWRLRWSISFHKIGLKVIGVFTEKVPAEPPPFVLKIFPLEGLSKLYLVVGLASNNFLEGFLNTLKPLYVVKGLEFSFWVPDKLLVKAGYGFKPQDYPGIMDLMELPEEEPFLRVPDKVDWAILTHKMNSPFKRFKTAYEDARKEDPSLKPISPQALTLHIQRHILPLWTGNYGYPYFPDPERPIEVFYLEGWRSHVASRLAARIPGTHFVIIDNNRAIIVGQYTGPRKAALLATIGGVKASVPLSELVCPPGKEETYMWRFWRFASNKKYVLPSEKPTRIEDTII